MGWPKEVDIYLKLDIYSYYWKESGTGILLQYI